MTKVFRYSEGISLSEIKEDSREKTPQVEVASDIMTAKEQEAFYKSFGQDVPETPQSIDNAKERLKEAERNQYKNR